MTPKSRFFHAGMTVFLTVCAILLFYDTFFGSNTLVVFALKLLEATGPILFGAMVAYLLAPAINFIESHLFSNALQKARDRGKFSAKHIRILSLLITWVIISFAGYLLISMLIPELYKSIMMLANNVENYYHVVSGWMQKLLADNPEIEEWVASQMDSAFENARNWLEKEVLPHAATVLGIATSGLASIVNFFKTVLIGVIVSIYLLATKEGCAAYARKIAYSLFRKEQVYWILRGVRKIDEIFSGFVRGKLLDSLIIGVICFVGCSIFGFPYTPLVSVIVGVTNIIPFFGPFLGAIPSIFLILLVSPIQALYFIIFVLVLQQLDGNIIGPMILGDRTGLSSLWVMIAILVGGSFFGILGMFFGVPVFACLYSAATFLIDTFLKKKGLPDNLDAYTKDLSPNSINSVQTDQTENSTSKS